MEREPFFPWTAELEQQNAKKSLGGRGHFFGGRTNGMNPPYIYFAGVSPPRASSNYQDLLPRLNCSLFFPVVRDLLPNM